MKTRKKNAAAKIPNISTMNQSNGLDELFLSAESVNISNDNSSRGVMVVFVVVFVVMVFVVVIFEQVFKCVKL